MLAQKIGLTTVRETGPVIEYDGDVLSPLRNIMRKYEARARYLSLLGVRPFGDGMYYENAAERVNLLIQQ